MGRLKTAAGIWFLSASAALSAPVPWLEVKSQHFTVVTNSSEKDGRHAAWQFEQIRQALLIIWPWASIDGGRPITIFAVRDEPTLKSLGPQYWEGKRYRPTSFWVGDSDRTYIALRTDLPEPDDIGENPYQTAYWSYVSLVLHRSLPVGIPEWYARGVSEVLSNTIVREKELHVGRLMNNHLGEMRRTAAIPPEDFFAADRTSKYLTRELDSWLFESQAWAFVHFLMFGNRGEHRAKVDRFNQLLVKGTPADVAMKEAFGPDMTPYFAGMREYVKRQIFQYAQIPVALDLKPEGFASRSLPAAESAILRSRFLVAMNRPVEARAAATEATAADASSPGPSEIEARLFDREGKTAEAQAAFARAVELGSKRAQVYYRLAQMTRPPGGADRATNEKIAAMLQKAVELEPDYANALSFLADVKSGLGKSEEAIPLASKAVTLDPQSTYHRVALARALWNSGRRDEALASARAALSVADTDQARDSAQQFIDFIEKSSRPVDRSSASTNSGDVIVPPRRISPAETPAPAKQDRAVIEMETVFDRCFDDRDNLACGKTLPFLEAKCRKGDGRACRQLGSLHDGGFGVPMDKMKAAAAYDEGCVTGKDQASCARYAVLQVEGLGVQKNRAAGLSTLEKLCGEKVDDACIGWALILAAPGQGRNPAKAAALLQATCDAKNDEACRILKSMPSK